jgi:hypothetical protein
VYVGSKAAGCCPLVVPAKMPGDCGLVVLVPTAGGTSSSEPVKTQTAASPNAQTRTTAPNTDRTFLS